MDGALDKILVHQTGTKLHIHQSVSASLGVTYCKSTGTFCTSVCASVASSLAVASSPSNICRGAIAITVGQYYRFSHKMTSPHEDNPPHCAARQILWLVGERIHPLRVLKISRQSKYSTSLDFYNYQNSQNNSYQNPIPSLDKRLFGVVQQLFGSDFNLPKFAKLSAMNPFHGNTLSSYRKCA